MEKYCLSNFGWRLVLGSFCLSAIVHLIAYNVYDRPTHSSADRICLRHWKNPNIKILVEKDRGIDLMLSVSAN